MSDRGMYRVMVRVTTEREVVVHADGYDEAEIMAMVEAVALTGGTDAKVVWAVEVADD